MKGWMDERDDNKNEFVTVVVVVLEVLEGEKSGDEGKKVFSTETKYYEFTDTITLPQRCRLHVHSPLDFVDPTGCVNSIFPLRVTRIYWIFGSIQRLFPPPIVRCT